MNISIASYAFHGLLREGKIDVFGYLETCKYRYGLASADIWNGFMPTIEDDYLAKLKDGLDERELVLANLCVDGPHIWEDDPEVRAKHHADGLAYLRAAECWVRAPSASMRACVQTPSPMSSSTPSSNATGNTPSARMTTAIKVGPENHWGAEVVPENMTRICKAVDHPGFGMLLHFRGNAGDALMAPWAMHTHISMEVVTNSLEQSMTMLRDAGYTGFWGVEHHSGQNEYAEVAIQVARVRDVLERWRAAGSVG